MFGTNSHLVPTSLNLTLRLDSGGEAEAEEDEEEEAGEPEGHCSRVIVEGAGATQVNGEYALAGVHDGVGTFAREVVVGHRITTFTLFRCRLEDTTRRWFLSVVPSWASAPGTAQDFDYYEVATGNLVGEMPHRFPPRAGWRTCRTTPPHVVDRYCPGLLPPLDPPPFFRPVIQPIGRVSEAPRETPEAADTPASLMGGGAMRQVYPPPRGACDSRPEHSGSLRT